MKGDSSILEPTTNQKKSPKHKIDYKFISQNIVDKHRKIFRYLIASHLKSTEYEKALEIITSEQMRARDFLECFFICLINGKKVEAQGFLEEVLKREGKDEKVDEFIIIHKLASLKNKEEILNYINELILNNPINFVYRLIFDKDVFDHLKKKGLPNQYFIKKSDEFRSLSPKTIELLRTHPKYEGVSITDLIREGRINYYDIFHKSYKRRHHQRYFAIYFYCSNARKAPLSSVNYERSSENEKKRYKENVEEVVSEKFEFFYPVKYNYFYR